MYEKLTLVFLVLSGFSLLSMMLFGVAMWITDGAHLKTWEEFLGDMFSISGIMLLVFVFCALVTAGAWSCALVWHHPFTH